MGILAATVAAAATSMITGLLLRAYLRYRRRTKSGREWQTFKAQMPAWLALTERAIQVVFWLALMAAWSAGFLHWHMVLNGGGRGNSSQGIIIFSGLFGTMAPSMILMNLVSWLVPPMRRANFAAMEGLGTANFAAANAGLLKFAAIMTPPCLAAAIVAVFQPWT